MGYYAITQSIISACWKAEIVTDDVSQCMFVDRRRFPTDDATETSAVDVAAKLVADAAGRLLLGNLTSLKEVTETEERYKSLQTRLRHSESDSVDQVS